MRTESRVEKIFSYDKALYSLMCVWLVPFCLIMDKSQTRLSVVDIPWSIFLIALVPVSWVGSLGVAWLSTDSEQERLKNTPWVAVHLLLLLTISIWTTIASQVAFSTVFHSILSLFVIAVPSWLLLRLSKTM